MPFWHRIAFFESFYDRLASAVCEEVRQELVTVVHDIDHKQLHVIVAQARHVLPRNFTVWRDYLDI
jgi:hypothetical protein